MPQHTTMGGIGLIRHYEMFSQVCRGFIHAVLSMPRLEPATIKRIWKQLQIP